MKTNLPHVMAIEGSIHNFFFGILSYKCNLWHLHAEITIKASFLVACLLYYCSTQPFHQMWRTWQSASEQCWWPRSRWRSTRTTRRCWWTSSTAWLSLTPARLSSARPGWTAWLASTTRTEIFQRSFQNIDFDNIFNFISVLSAL